MNSEPLRLGSRKSPMAIAQSGDVARLITERTGRRVEIVGVTTLGDVSREHVTQIVLGRPHRSWWQAPFRRSLPESVLRQAGEVGVHIVPGEQTPQHLRWVRRGRSLPEWIITIAAPVLSVGAISAIGLGLSELVTLQKQALA